jgi:hypothetical protein
MASRDIRMHIPVAFTMIREFPCRLRSLLMCLAIAICIEWVKTNIPDYEESNEFNILPEE